MKRRLTYVGLIITLFVWMWLATFAFNLLNVKSDFALFAGGSLLLASIVFFPELIRVAFGKQIKQDITTLFDRIFHEHSEEKQ